MKITKRWLRAHKACDPAVQWYLKQKTEDAEQLLEAYLSDSSVNSGQEDWSVWVLTRKFSRADSIRVCIYLSNLVSPLLYGSSFPYAKYLEAAELCLSDPSRKNKRSALQLWFNGVRSCLDNNAPITHTQKVFLYAAFTSGSSDRIYRQHAVRRAISSTCMALNCTGEVRSMIVSYGLFLLTGGQP